MYLKAQKLHKSEIMCLWNKKTEDIYKSKSMSVSIYTIHSSIRVFSKQIAIFGVFRLCFYMRYNNICDAAFDQG